MTYSRLLAKEFLTRVHLTTLQDLFWLLYLESMNAKFTEHKLFAVIMSSIFAYHNILRLNTARFGSGPLPGKNQ